MPTLLTYLTAFCTAVDDESAALSERLARPSSETRNAHRAATVRKCQVKARFEEALREADERREHCVTTHVEMVEPGVFAIEMERAS